MAPVEFEKELKKRLHSREVRPSAEAWERIASRLEGEDPGHGRIPRWWMGLAASVLLLVALAFFWDRPEPLPATGPLVNTPEVEIPAEDPGEEGNPVDLSPQPAEAIPVAASKTDRSDLSVAPEKSGPEAMQANTRGLAAAPLQDSPTLGDPDRIPGLIALQIDTVLARVVAFEQAGGGISDAQIDSLLREAQQNIVREGVQEDQSSLDPSMLLAQAEDELDQTFREQILEKLKTEYTRIRNSVADRNK